MKYYNVIKEKILESEIYDKAHDYAKDRNKVKAYYEIGQLLNAAGKDYGKNIIKQYSEKLMLEVGKKYNERNLRYMRKFYEVFSNIKWNPMGSKLSWSHYRELLVVNNTDAIMYYIKVCEKNNYTKRTMQEKIKSKEYERLSNEAKNKLISNEQLNIYDVVPNPIVIKSNLLKNKLTEYALKQAILTNIDDFLLQLGSSFAYVGNEYRIKINNKYNFIDLMLFNYEYNCFIVVELKVTEIKKEHLGQIQFYMNYVDKNLRRPNQNKTIGIIICKKDDGYIIEFSSDHRIMARTYELV